MGAMMREHFKLIAHCFKGYYYILEGGVIVLSKGKVKTL